MQVDKYSLSGALAGSAMTLAYGGNPFSAAVGAVFSSVPALIIAPILNFVFANIRREPRRLEFNLSNPSKEQQYILGGALGAAVSLPVCSRGVNYLENTVEFGDVAQTFATIGAGGVVTASAIGGAYLSRKLFSSYPEERNKLMKKIGIGALLGAGTSFIIYNMI